MNLPAMSPLEPASSPSLHLACADALDFLQALDRAAVQPEEALLRLRDLRRRHCGVDIELVWDREPYAGSLHYDALISADGVDTVSLGYCPDHGTPWPFRGIQRHSAANLLEVDNEVMRVDQAIQLLDFMWDDTRLVESLVNASILHRAFIDREVDISGEELQVAMNEFRLERGLATREQTLAWMERHGMDHPRLEYYVADRARVAKLRRRITEVDIDAHFAEHHRDYDRVVMGLVSLKSAEEAEAFHARAAAGAPSFFAAASERVVDLARRGVPSSDELLVIRRRHELDPALAQAVHDAPAGRVLAPISAGPLHHVVCILEHCAAKLDDDTRELVSKELFERWLAEQRAQAKIKWFWGRQ